MSSGLNSETLEPHLRETARLLHGHDVTEFRSHVFRRADGLGYRWREAFLNPSGTWTVQSCDSWPSAQDPEKSTIKSTDQGGLCFWDALYSVASYDQFDGHHNLQKADPVPAMADRPHHRARVEAIGIPYDESGMPLLTANGRILTGGTYSEDAVAIAKNAPVLQARPAQALATFSAGDMLTKKPVTSAALALQNEQKNLVLENTLTDGKRKINRAVEDIIYGNEYAFDKVAYGVKGTAGNALISATGLGGGTGLLLAGTAIGIPLIGFPIAFVGVCSMIFGGMVGIASFIMPFQKENGYKGQMRSPRGVTEGGLKKLDKMIENMPEGSDLRAEAEAFRADMLISYYALQARHAFKKAAQKPGASAEKAFNKALSTYNAVAQKMNVDASRITAIYNGIIEPVSSDRLEETLIHHLKYAGQRLNQKMTDALNARPAITQVSSNAPKTPGLERP